VVSYRGATDRHKRAADAAVGAGSGITDGQHAVWLVSNVSMLGRAPYGDEAHIAGWIRRQLPSLDSEIAGRAIGFALCNGGIWKLWNRPPRRVQNLTLEATGASWGGNAAPHNDYASKLFGIPGLLVMRDGMCHLLATEAKHRGDVHASRETPPPAAVVAAAHTTVMNIALGTGVAVATNADISANASADGRPLARFWRQDCELFSECPSSMSYVGDFPVADAKILSLMGKAGLSKGKWMEPRLTKWISEQTLITEQSTRGGSNEEGETAGLLEGGTCTCANGKVRNSFCVHKHDSTSASCHHIYLQTESITRSTIPCLRPSSNQLQWLACSREGLAENILQLNSSRPTFTASAGIPRCLLQSREQHVQVRSRVLQWENRHIRACQAKRRFVHRGSVRREEGKVESAQPDWSCTYGRDGRGWLGSTCGP
jgi:hypothetical protein